jgi:hypothetical protein
VLCLGCGYSPAMHGLYETMNLVDFGHSHTFGPILHTL